MMKDVDDCIQTDPKKALRKAHDMIHRMTRLYEITGVPDYRPTVQAYNLWITRLGEIGTAKERDTTRKPSCKRCVPQESRPVP